MLEWGRLGAADCLRLRGGASRAGRLAVYPCNVIDAPDRPLALPPVAGRFEVDGDDLCFLPRFGFAPGTDLVVLDRQEDASWRVAAPQADGEATTRLLGIEPDVAVLPHNALRLVLCFSAPMSEGVAADHVRLVDEATGEDVPFPFSPLEPELWDGERRRLTVLFDPARIKRGLRPHDEAGYPLTEGRAVRVVVGAGFPDAAGRPIVDGGARPYAVGPDERRRLDPAAWSIDAPAAGTTDPLVVRFDRPVDAVLARRCLAVEGTAGSTGIATGQDAWSFVPSSPWAPDEHTLVVDPRLEDLAGNSVTRVFDRDLADAADDPAPPGPVRLPCTPN